jgi:cytosine deaminase
MVYEALLLLDGTLPDGSRADLTIVDGFIQTVTPAVPSTDARPSGTDEVHVSALLREHARTSSARSIDLDGHLVLPALVNGHAHLDKTFVGAQWQPHRAGTTVAARVTAERAIRSALDKTVHERATSLAAAMIEFGTGTVRTHVDIDTEVGLSSLDAVLQLREALRSVLRVQIVAFPQSGILASPGVDRLLEEALIAGADAIGGLDPAGFDDDAAKHLDLVFALAASYGVAVDIHLHELGESAVHQYGMIAELTRDHALEGRVVVSHAYGLGSIGLDLARRVGAEFAASGVSVMTNGPAGPMPPVLAMRSEGTTVFSGSDNIRDAWWPYGDGDMLAVARQVAYQSNFRTDDELEVALDMVTGSAATALGLGAYGVVAGAPADLLIIDSPSSAAAIAATPNSRLVLHGGEIVAGQVLASHSSAPSRRGALTPSSP